MAPRRVAITGVGLVSCLGHDYSQVVRALQNGASGLRAMPSWESLGLKSRVAGAIMDVETKFERSSIPKRLRPVISEASKYCCLAALDAVGDSGLPEADVQSDRTACIVGTGIGSVDSIYTGGRQVHSGEIAKVSPFVVLKSMASASSAAVANLLKVHGRSYSISSACSTSSHSIGTAYELIRFGIVDRAIAGGGEEVHPLIAAGFQALRFALASKFNERPEQASRPYDIARDGFVIGGGAGIVVLEALDQALARRARVRAEIVGFGTSSDGFDMVMPEPSGVQAAECMRRDESPRRRCRQHARHGDHQRRRRRSRGNEAGVRRQTAAVLIDKIDDRSSLGCCGSARNDLLRGHARARLHSPFHQHREPRSRIRGNADRNGSEVHGAAHHTFQ
jgi:3-oxoacyl-[acyl-carrier-protein] synthase I